MSGDSDSMNIRIIHLVSILLLISGGLCLSSTENSAVDSMSKQGLTIYLPREAVVESENLTLGKIAVITGEEKLVAKAGDVELGKILLADQVITIDRSMITSRLACSGIPACNLVLSGADKVSIRRKAEVIKSSSIAESASSFLAGSIKEKSIARWEPVKMPADVTLSAQTENIELVPRLISRGTNGQAVMEVGIVAEGKQIEARQIVFKPKYNVHRAVTLADVKEGTALSADNTKIEEIISDKPQAADWQSPYGLVATRNLPEGTVIASNMAKSPVPPVLIERNQNVIIRIERGGLIVTATGKATEKGRLGDCIKVRNTDSQRVILAKVNEDGTVEPVF
jgi:flagella basal body P-ring formation protein FlgA